MRYCIMLLCLCLVGCAPVAPYQTAQKEILEFSLAPISLYLITNVSQFPVTPKSDLTVGMWILRYGMSEEIWVCAVKNGDRWTPEQGVIEHEVLHALRYRNHAAIKNPDDRGLGAIIVVDEVTREDLKRPPEQSEE